MKKRMLAFLLIASILTVLVAGNFSVYAANSVEFALKSDIGAVESGKTVTITITSDQINNVAGFQITLLYDSALFGYKSGSIVNSSFASTGVIGSNSPGKVNCVWSGGSSGNGSVSSAAGTLFTATFTALNVSSEQTGNFTLEIVELFNSYWKNISSTVKNTVSVTAKPALADPAVTEVEGLINAIGTVQYTKECGDCIDAAYNAFKALKASQQNTVSNYNKLSSALNEYERLREQNIQDEFANALQKEVDDFKALPILKKTVNTVTVNDATAVSEALSLYGNKSYLIKDKLSAEYKKLKDLQNAIGVLLKKSEAEIAAGEFRAVNSYVLSVKKEKMPFVDIFYEKLIEAVGQYENLVEANPVCKDLLKGEYNHLMELVKEFERLQILNAPDSEEIIKIANSFTMKYTRLFSLTASDLTEENISQINAAIAEYLTLPNAAKGRLINQYERLNNLLYSKDGEATIIEVEKPGETEKEYVYLDKDAKADKQAAEQKALSVAGIALGSRVIWFFILFGISFLFMCVSITLYLFGKKKYVRRSEV